MSLTVKEKLIRWKHSKKKKKKVHRWSQIVNNRNVCHMTLARWSQPVPDRGCEETCQQADCSILRVTLLTNTAYVCSRNDAQRGERRKKKKKTDGWTAE